MAVDGKSNFDGTFTVVTQHDGKFLAVDGFPFFNGNSLAVEGNSNFDGKSPLYRDRPPVRYVYVGKITEHSPENFLLFFWHPRCDLSDGCHLSDTDAEIQLNHLVLVFSRHPRCHLSDGCDAEWYVCCALG